MVSCQECHGIFNALAADFFHLSGRYFKFFALLLLKFSFEWYKHHFKMILAPETISKIKIEFGSNKDAKGL